MSEFCSSLWIPMTSCLLHPSLETPRSSEEVHGCVGGVGCTNRGRQSGCRLHSLALPERHLVLGSLVLLSSIILIVLQINIGLVSPVLPQQEIAYMVGVPSCFTGCLVLLTVLFSKPTLLIFSLLSEAIVMCISVISGILLVVKQAPLHEAVGLLCLITVFLQLMHAGFSCYELCQSEEDRDSGELYGCGAEEGMSEEAATREQGACSRICHCCTNSAYQPRRRRQVGEAAASRYRSASLRLCSEPVEPPSYASAFEFAQHRETLSPIETMTRAAGKPAEEPRPQSPPSFAAVTLALSRLSSRRLRHRRNGPRKQTPPERLTLISNFRASVAANVAPISSQAGTFGYRCYTISSGVLVDTGSGSHLTNLPTSHQPNLDDQLCPLPRSKRDGQPRKNNTLLANGILMMPLNWDKPRRSRLLNQVEPMRHSSRRCLSESDLSYVNGTQIIRLTAGSSEGNLRETQIRFGISSPMPPESLAPPPYKFENLSRDL
ncbi:unnamed protein product [Protopolystoma xenopodis]|uniref:Uncharacterized protein n=1 Tax=Protopolystoma xenopodis TaxID=117903 RepID=A0A3S5A1Z0_9PLAT|nr:unnamed protein product [Protopolystoma xenopodis]